MNDSIIEKRTRWIQDAQRTSIIELYQLVDFLLLGLFLLLLILIMLELA